MRSTVTAVLHFRATGANPLVPTYGEAAVLFVFVALIALFVVAVVFLAGPVAGRRPEPCARQPVALRP